MKTTLEQREKILIRVASVMTTKFNGVEGALENFDSFVIKSIYRNGKKVQVD